MKEKLKKIPQPLQKQIIIKYVYNQRSLAIKRLRERLLKEREKEK